MPDEALAPVGWRTAYADEIPGGAAAVAKRAEKAGWKVRVGFARGPWLTGNEDDEEESTDEVKICQMVSVQGRKGEQKFHANWHCKLWTKPGAEGKYTFAGAWMWPAIAGEPFSTKAKKDRHPENAGAATVGGLKNSKTLNDYLKES